MPKDIVMIDLDATRFGNLALMKLSAWHKQRGDKVILIYAKKLSNIPVGNIRYASCVFAKNSSRVMGLDAIVGGSGIDLKTTLPDEIEHIMPDYDLYGLDHSVGFTTRGCKRKCPFCIVPEKEGRIHVCADWREFWDKRHNKITLLDNNLLASPSWRETLKTLSESGIKVDFNQGLDIRLMTDEIAYLLSKCKTWIGSYDAPGLRFAFDDPKLESQVRKGVKLLTKYIGKGILYFFVLVGFVTTFEEDMHRFRVLKELGTCAYPMFYEDLEGTSYPPDITPIGRHVEEKELPRGPRSGIRKYVRLVNA